VQGLARVSLAAVQLACVMCTDASDGGGGRAENQDAIDSRLGDDDDDGVCAGRLSSGEPVWAAGRGYACAVLPHSQATTG
jgi:hypothetical protein